MDLISKGLFQPTWLYDSSCMRMLTTHRHVCVRYPHTPPRALTHHQHLWIHAQILFLRLASPCLRDCLLPSQNYLFSLWGSAPPRENPDLLHLCSSLPGLLKLPLHQRGARNISAVLGMPGWCPGLSGRPRALTAPSRQGGRCRCCTSHPQSLCLHNAAARGTEPRGCIKTNTHLCQR